MMCMQDDAKSRRISSEVMKHRLYESVVTSPRRRRFSARLDFPSVPGCDVQIDHGAFGRMAVSMPVTPAHSENVTPAHSPTSNRKFGFGFFSRGTTPHGMTPEEEEEETLMEVEEDSWKGLASLFKPQPKYIPGATVSPNVSMHQDLLGEDEEMMATDSNSITTGFFGAQRRGVPPLDSGIHLRSVPAGRKRSRSPSPTLNVRGKDLNVITPSNF